MENSEISKTAVELVNGARQDVYGHPYDNFKDIGRIWGSLLNLPDIDPEQVALMMMGVKLARLKHKYHVDGIVDFIGYENCLDQIVDYKQRNGLPTDSKIQNPAEAETHPSIENIRAKFQKILNSDLPMPETTIA